MKNMYVEIRMEDMDKNKDKYLTLSEYLGMLLNNKESVLLSNIFVLLCRGCVAIK